METPIINDMDGDSLYPAGSVATPGYYRDIETQREVYLDHEDRLPASLDGRVAHYRRVSTTFSQPQCDPGPYVTDWSLPPTRYSAAAAARQSEAGVCAPSD